MFGIGEEAKLKIAPRTKRNKSCQRIERLLVDKTKCTNKNVGNAKVK